VRAVLPAGFQGEGVKGYFGFVKKQCTIPFLVLVALIAAIIIGGLTSWVVIRAGSYSKLLSIKDGDFASEVEEISYNQIPMLDEDSAARLGSRKLGELADMVSQFEILPSYTQINYQGRPVRVTSLAYGDLVKWFTNRSAGLPAYLIIDMVTQEAEVVRLDEGMKYTTAEHFGRYLPRHLRFHYPTYMFADPVFEINEEGEPYWVCPRMVKTIGLFGGADIQGAVLVNAVTGESQYYEEVPNWVDHVYDANLIMEQYDYYGMYHNGFINSIFGQRDVTHTTEGYNYIAIGDDVYMYTGVTSVTSDQSNIGFILSNQRTKETHFYSVAGATEASAQASAMSQVQQMRYVATFPLLLNIADQPTYFMSLKGEDGLVKMYAMVNVQQYNIVETGSTVAECEANYRRALADSGLISDGDAEAVPSDQEEISGAIAEIRTAVLDGNSYYFLRLEGQDTFYAVNAAENPLAGILKVPSVIIGLTIVAMGTSAPEASVSINAALAGSNDIAISNVVGSNIFNGLVVVGICAFLHSFMPHGEILKRDMPLNILVTVVLCLMFLDGSLSRIEGAVLLLGMIVYLGFMIYSARKNREEGEPGKILSLPRSLLYIAGGLAAVIFGGDLVVDKACIIATNFGVSQNFIGLTIIAIGTSLPELVTSIVATKKGYSEGFTKHMAEVKEWLLGKNGPASLQLVGTTDEICSACPHNKGGSCESAEKVDRYDAGVLKYTGLKAGQEMTFAEFERIVEEKILQPGYGKVICGDCQWRDICHK